MIINPVGALLAAPDFKMVGIDVECGNMETENTEKGNTEKGNMGAENTNIENKGAASSAPTKSATLGGIMRAFKSVSGIEVNRILDRPGRPFWQRNYYERIIRNDIELSSIREYILHNPLKWANDEEYAP